LEKPVRCTLFRRSASLLIISIFIASCHSNHQVLTEGPHLKKITFDLNQLDENGLSGPEGGKVAVSYEFCIPNTAQHIKEVSGIDQTLNMQYGSPGRIGCLRGREVLCVGHTNQKDYKQVLYQLAALPYIQQIRQTFFE
jgi:hypothetical protein